MKRHTRLDSREETFICDTCNLDFSRKSNLQRHCLRKHGVAPKIGASVAPDQQCAVCGKLWWTPGELKQHMKSHTGEKPYECVRCDKSFCRRNYLHEHCQRVHGSTSRGTSTHRKATAKPQSDSTATVQDRSCPFCGIVFDSPSNMKRHMRVHTGEKPFKCGTCGVTFIRTESLNQHCQKVHDSVSTDKPQSDSPVTEQDRTCPICGMVFDFPSNMKRHMVQHTGEKPYQCSTCVEYFSQAAALEEHHQKIHKKGKERIPAKDRTCKFCDVVFSTIAKLVDHSQDECTPLPYEVSIKQEEEEAEVEEPPPPAM